MQPRAHRAALSLDATGAAFSPAKGLEIPAIGFYRILSDPQFVIVVTNLLSIVPVLIIFLLTRRFVIDAFAPRI